MSRWLRPWWLLGHLVIGVIAVACLRLGWWQWEHARQGNTLSYGYALQWPLFAAFGVFFWTRVVRERIHRRSGEAQQHLPPLADTIGHSWSYQRGGTLHAPAAQLVPTRPAPSPTDDPDAVAYEHMLAWLNADPTRHVSDYPGFDGR